MSLTLVVDNTKVAIPTQVQNHVVQLKRLVQAGDANAYNALSERIIVGAIVDKKMKTVANGQLVLGMKDIEREMYEIREYLRMLWEGTA